MYRIFLLLLTFLNFVQFTNAQSTGIEIYNVFQEKCASCHSNASPAAGLDLEGAGVSLFAKTQVVLNNIVNISPSNAYAADKGYKHVYPGRADKSFLFRAINDDFEPYIVQDAAEGNHADTGATPLSKEEKELIRQWINFGAPVSGTVIDTDLIADYYNVNGLSSFPNGAPDAPAATEGFQIKMNPFLLAPSGEIEFFQKYELDLSENIEVKRIEIIMANYSHHMIVYDFNEGGSSNIPAGLRLEPDHSQIGLVAAVQEPTDLRLPEGTAFKWKKDHVLDLNSHYINYTATNTYMAEVYVNVYTQASGTAVQEMKTELIPYYNIFIPNNGNPVDFDDVVNFNLGEIYIWGLMGHTHKYGTDYKMYRRLNFAQDEMLYDAACPQGIPGCVSPYFDYQHIPMRYFDEFLPLTMNFSNGLIHEAEWVNDGPNSVGFGSTSADEMMVTIFMYVDDISELPTSTKELFNSLENVQLFPNPVQDQATIQLPSDISNAQFTLYDVLGQPIQQIQQHGFDDIIFERGNLVTGMYIYKIETTNGQATSGKIILE